MPPLLDVMSELSVSVFRHILRCSRPAWSTPNDPCWCFRICHFISEEYSLEEHAGSSRAERAVRVRVLSPGCRLFAERRTGSGPSRPVLRRETRLLHAERENPYPCVAVPSVQHGIADAGGTHRTKHHTSPAIYGQFVLGAGPKFVCSMVMESAQGQLQQTVSLCPRYCITSTAIEAV